MNNLKGLRLLHSTTKTLAGREQGLSGDLNTHHTCTAVTLGETAEL